MAVDLAVLASDPGALELAADPGQFVILACERAKQWLTEALNNGEIDQLVELKSQAEAIRIYSAQKQIGKDAELAATEIVRRAERGIGVAIRRGQEAGEIARRGTVGGPADGHRGDHLKRPNDFISTNELTGNGAGIYAMTDEVPDDLFDEAIEEAKAEGNLSRANVVRKVKGEPPAGPKNEWHRKRRHLDPNRIIRESTITLEGVVSSLRLIDDFDDVEVEDWWVESLTESLTHIRKLRDTLRGMA